MELHRVLPLSEHVINRIAAGEVIQRPSSAVKELIENSVDAGSANVSVILKGASAMLQVQDDGQGIHQEDLSLLCKRFNTSKLRDFDDLKRMTTYGFRGEALSSITHVARVTITSQRANQSCSMRASYRDGAMVGKPSKCAGLPGTTITVEDLFYNVPQRLRALKSQAEEYAKVLEICQKYAIHTSGKVGFTCKKAGANTPDVHTASTNTIQENVRSIYGSDVVRELVELVCEPHVAYESFRGFVTNPNYSRKKGEFLLFINGRLVESSSLKRIVDAKYSDYLPKGGHPFVYLSLSLPLENIDVNVHPTKREVQFLNEEEICEELGKALSKVLAGANESRTFATTKIQTTLGSMKKNELDDDDDDDVLKDDDNEQVDQPLPLASQKWKLEMPTGEAALKKKIGAYVMDDDDEEDVSEEQLSTRKRSSAAAAKSLEESDLLGKLIKKSSGIEPRKLVRTDASAGTGMERFIVAEPRQRASASNEDGVGDDDFQSQPDETKACECTAGHGEHAEEKKSTRTKITQPKLLYMPAPMDDLDNAPLIVPDSDAMSLQSVEGLWKQVQARTHAALTESIRSSVFVGMIDETFSLVQMETSLVAIDHVRLIRELLYQRCLCLFGRNLRFTVDQPPRLVDLLNGNQELADGLQEKGGLLFEYFGIDIRDGTVKTIPKLLSGYAPLATAIPKLIKRLAKADSSVWESEESCFRGIARALAIAYSDLPGFVPLITTKPDALAMVSTSDRTSPQYLMKNIIFPAMRSYMVISRELGDPRNGCIVPVARLEQLYRIFERC